MQHENIHILTYIIIYAPIEKVWEVISDLENWNKWTKLVLSAQGTISQDAPITIEFANPEGGGMTFQRTIFHFDNGKAFGWTGDAFAGLKDYHIYELVELPDRTTKFIQSDGLHGAEVSGVEVLEQQILEGYKIFNQQLKNFVESN
jgi:hypothetical protein